MTDDTEASRRALIPEMPAALMREVRAGRPVWDSEQMRATFSVVGFMAPFVVVVRRSDGVRGSLSFTHDPRWYFDWTPAETDHS